MNAITTAAGVVLVGVGGAYAYTQIQKGRALASGVRAGNQLMAAGGDPSTLNTILDALKGAGGETAGAAQAAGGIASNDNAGTYGIAVLDSAAEAMRKAGSPAGLGRNLRVIRPRDKSSEWVIGEGCWLPSEGEANDFRTSPVENVRGLDLGYALTYLPDVYPSPASGGAVIAYPARYGFYNGVFNHNGGQEYFKRASETGTRERFEVMITSTAQEGGAVALWDRDAKQFAPNGTPVRFAVMIEPRPIGLLGTGYGARSTFLVDLCNALQSRPVFQPFPPRRLSSKRNR